VIRAAQIEAHYKANWGSAGIPCVFGNGPFAELPADFAVLKFPPRPNRQMWTFATRCMGQHADQEPLELHCFSATEEASLVELLYMAAHFHRTGSKLSLGHSVNIGRPWWPGSTLSFGLISLPYLDGPLLENLAEGRSRFLWLVPVYNSEVQFKARMGLDALEHALERANFNYLDPMRTKVV
jgi:hypothetical protein